MSRSMTVALTAFVSMNAWAGAPKGARMSDGDAQFATQLYGKIAHEPGNLFFSPASVRLALAMAYAGAKGATADQMRNALALPEGKAAHEGRRTC